MSASTFTISEFLEGCVWLSEEVASPDPRMDAAGKGKEAVSKANLVSAPPGYLSCSHSSFYTAANSSLPSCSPPPPQRRW